MKWRRGEKRVIEEKRGEVAERECPWNVRVNESSCAAHVEAKRCVHCMPEQTRNRHGSTGK